MPNMVLISSLEPGLVTNFTLIGIQYAMFLCKKSKLKEAFNMQVRTHFARPNWKEEFMKIAQKHPFATVGKAFCCRMNNT